MTTPSGDLDTLLRNVDHWFQDISLDEPVSRFILTSDRTKLALIGRTTGNWFKALSEPQLSDIEIEDPTDDDEELVNATKRKRKKRDSAHKIKGRNCGDRIKEHETIDSMAKSLELLLADHFSEKKYDSNSKDESEIYFNVYTNDDIAILDETLGHCCTINQFVEETSSRAHSYTQPKIIDISTMNSYRTRTYDDLKVQTVMPPDHDYLSKPRTKPLEISNKSSLQNSKNVYQEKKQSSVLIGEAIKRFARFSNDFRVLSNKHSD